MSELILPKVTFKRDFRVFSKGDSISFKSPLTIITGDNGSGKSSLMACIRNIFDCDWSFSHQNSAVDVIEDFIEKSKKCEYICLSKDLLANSPQIEFKNFSLQKRSFSLSSGQGSLLQLAALLESAEADLYILDEPDRGLSEAKQLIVIELIRQLQHRKPDAQILITTHSSLIMDMVDEVLSLSSLEYMSKDKYLFLLRAKAHLEVAELKSKLEK